MTARAAILVTGALSAMAAGAAEPVRSDVEPLTIEVQAGSATIVEIGRSVKRVSVARPSVAGVRAVGGEAVEIRGVAIGHTMAVVWHDAGRQLLVVYVAARPVQPLPAGRAVRQKRNDGLLAVYRGSVSGTARRGEEAVYTGQQHSLSMAAATLDGAVSGEVDYLAPKVGPARVSRAIMRYDDPLLSLELGDVSAATLSTLGILPQVRGGLAGYHDGKYQLLLFGGVLRSPGEDLYSFGGPMQLGVQTQFFAAENLSFSVQGTRTQSAQADPWLVANPSLRWLPAPSVSFDVEGGVSSEGTAARARLSYEAPAISINGLYQLMGNGYISPGSVRADVGQVSVVMTPSSYYQIFGVAGRAATGGPVWSSSVTAESTFVDSSVSLFPWGAFGSTTFDLRYRDESTRVGLAGAAASRRVQRAEAGLQAPLAGGGYYRVAAIGDQTTDDRGPTPGEPARGLGGRASVVFFSIADVLRTATEASYERRYLPAGETNYYAVGQSVALDLGALSTSLALYGTREDFATGSAYGWSGSAGLALRPTAAHELRGDLQFYRTEGGRRDAEPFGLPRYYAGMVSYTHQFGSAVDAPGILDLLIGSSVEVTVYVDANEDGVQQPDEAGVAGVAVYVDDERLDTDARGRAGFSRLSAGPHELKVVPAIEDGIKFTTASHRRFLLGRDDRAEIEVGLSDRSQVFGVVFNDANLDGEMQVGEPGVGNVRVRLVDGVSYEQFASGSGSFAFKGLQPGPYYLELDPRTFPASFSARAIAKNGNGKNGRGKQPNGKNGHAKSGNGHSGNGSNAANGNDIPAPLRAVHFELDRGQVSVLRIPLIALRTVEGRVFLDRDRDGQFTERDQGAAGVVVRAGRRQVMTDAQGRYLFRELPAGPVVIAVDPVSLPAGRILAGPGQVALQLPLVPASESVDFVLRAP